MFPTSILNPESLAIVLMFATPIVAILAYHHLKVVEMKLKARSNETVREELERLRAEFEQFRDTASRYDLSFDTALQRLESRIENLERQTVTLRPTHVGHEREG